MTTQKNVRLATRTVLASMGIVVSLFLIAAMLSGIARAQIASMYLNSGETSSFPE